MARIHHRKARKDYPANGIKRGDMYYYAKIKTGPYSSQVIRQREPIKRSQLTTSDFLSQFYDLEDRFNGLGSCGLADLEGELQSLADDARALGGEQQEKLDNMPEQLQEADSGQMLTERAEAMEAWASSLEEAVSTAAEKLSEFHELEGKWQAYDDALAGDDGPDAEERHEEPDEERPDEADLVQEVLDEIEEPSL